MDPTLKSDLKAGSKLLVHVFDFETNPKGDVVLRLGLLRPQDKAFKDFIRRFKKGSSLDVIMFRILKDPLERRPMFTVVELETGLEIPMSESDFCGDTFFRSYFGLRFCPGELFRVDIEEILDNREVYLSRARYLFSEYEQVPEEWDRTIQSVRITRVDPSGVYLAIQGRGAPYVTFVRRAVFPPGFHGQPGDLIRARLRRYDRNLNKKGVRVSLEAGEPLPKELDLGIEADLRIPPAFDKFRELHPIGDLLTVTVDKPLDSGGLLVDLGDGLKGMIYESELELKNDGKLKAGREYRPGERVMVRVTNLKESTAKVELSIFRTRVLPVEIKEGDLAEAQVLLVRSNPNQPDIRYITGSMRGEFRLDIRTNDPDFVVDLGDHVIAQIDLKYDKTQYLRATLVGME